MALTLSILHLRIIWHSDAWKATEKLCLTQKVLQMPDKVVWEVLDFLLLGLDIVMKEIDFQLVRKLLVQRVLYKVAIL